MIEPRTIYFDREAVMAMSQILGILLDQMFDFETSHQWSTEHVVELEARLADLVEDEPIVLGIGTQRDSSLRGWTRRIWSQHRQR